MRDVAGLHFNIVLDERNLPPREMAQLYAAADVIMSLHRSEGFGLVIAEASRLPVRSDGGAGVLQARAGHRSVGGVSQP